MKIKIGLPGMLLFGLMIASPVFLCAAESLTYIGIIDLYDSDDEGNPIQVGMYADEKDLGGEVVTRYFIIKDTPKGHELLGKVGETLKVKGRQEIDENGQTLLNVESYIAEK